MPISVPEVGWWLTRYRYRKEFGLSAEQMDNEPFDEVSVILKIWEAQKIRDDLEEQRAKSNKGKR